MTVLQYFNSSEVQKQRLITFSCYMKVFKYIRHTLRVQLLNQLFNIKLPDFNITAVKQ